MRLFTAWEVNLNIKYLKNYNIGTPEKRRLLIDAKILEENMTVNHAREILTLPPHPSAVHGAKYIWEADTTTIITNPEYYKIPLAVRQQYEAANGETFFTANTLYDANDFALV